MRSSKPLRALSPRLEIRPFVLRDFKEWQSFFSAIQNPTKTSKNKFDLKSYKAKLAKYRTLQAKDQMYVFGIFDRKSGALYGGIDLYVYMRKELQWANVGYEINRIYWNQGYATEALRATLLLAFQKLRLNRVEAATEIGNDASMKVALKAGMRAEGPRPHFYFENGSWNDYLIYAANPQDLGLHPSKPKI